MNIYDALKVLNITESGYTLESVNKAYRVQASKYHPDNNPAGLQMMQAINEAVEVVRAHIASGAESVKPKQTTFDADLNDALNAVINCAGVVIEICGAWVWLSGNTKERKDAIKAAGYKWSPNKSMWYFRPDDYAGYSRKGGTPMDDIRTKYGSVFVSNIQRKLTAA